MALTLTDVAFDYAVGTSLAQPALRGVTFSVAPGECVVVLGPSGSGKTTLLRIAGGLLIPSRGDVTVDGMSRGARRVDPFRGAVGLAFQRPEAQFFAATVGEDVAFGPRNLGNGDGAAAAESALELVGLSPGDFAERSPFTLSGGEARRAALAGILAMSPRYLLLDEPTSGLDAAGHRAVSEAIARARATAGVVVVTHDAAEFLDHADRVLVLQEGAAAFSGSVRDLLADADRLEAGGAWVPPEHVRAQLLARRLGRTTSPPVLDPGEAARILFASGGVT
ncbi:MAG: ATP-binding cassette domain-containing protein [Coriobacteriia bacterium]|nr:ATP-binding cassette domain-containing protein [Coriobacteriia bacterium]